MFMIVAPIFMVIFIGYGFGHLRPDDQSSDKLINNYVLYVALPALLFLAIAKADISELNQSGFIVATLAGIAAVYIAGTLIAKIMGFGMPQSAILSMGASYGTTGYMGVPILISVYGESAALPAAIATILHNIPTIMAVIVTYDILSNRNVGDKASVSKSVLNAIKTTVTNPLTVAVIAGLVFVFLGIPVPDFLTSFASFLGGAAGPTALFALGLGLARLNIRKHANREALKLVVPMVILKLVIQPAITFAIAYYLFGMQKTDTIWPIAAIVMAAQPIGAGVYVFSNKYGFKQEVISLSIIISLLIALITIPVILSLFPVLGAE
ncbi:AEC family transporter [Brenneria roseae subsp. americana]|uniref:AEC family transporter n=1 Tax=Brenneria roseae subsp. americana TaxID=1508507 RepID=A0A2U1TSD6_9GAMM|nr:AEC family transporter [Brenneria roseae]PWC12316.1 AEC family transporter [Brenneria roseae subsp. americana]